MPVTLADVRSSGWTGNEMRHTQLVRILREVRQFAHDHVQQRCNSLRVHLVMACEISLIFFSIGSRLADIAASCGRQERFGWLCTRRRAET
jgi:hypothetical protein